MVDLNRKERFATKGIRFQRHNPDGTIPTPERFLGFANTVDLDGILGDGDAAELTIKLDANAQTTKRIDFGKVADRNAVTVAEAVDALNAANFAGFEFAEDAKTGRVRGRLKAAGAGRPTVVKVALENAGADDIVVPAGKYAFSVGRFAFGHDLAAPQTIKGGKSVAWEFSTAGSELATNLPAKGADLTGKISPVLDAAVLATVESVSPGENPARAEGKIIQVLGPLAAALDFGQGIKHGGNGLEVISFFDDETISIGLPKDVKDKEEIDIEGANGTITRMVVGAMLQGLSPVVTAKVKDYFLLEMIQGGNFDRETWTYNPPLSKESEHPVVWAEIFSPVYSSGSNKLSDVSGYERILLRSMIGMEGDVPVEAKAWAQYAFNMTATEYTDETGEQFPAWEERAIMLEQFDALKVKRIKAA